MCFILFELQLFSVLCATIPDDDAFHNVYQDYLEEYHEFNPYSYEITNYNDFKLLVLTT